MTGSGRVAKCGPTFNSGLGSRLSTEILGRHSVFPQLDAHCSTVSVIRDTLCIKSRQADIAGFASYEIDFIIESLYVCVRLSVYCLLFSVFFFSFLNSVLLYDIHFK